MSIVVSFNDYVPTPRWDGLSWITIKIEESVSANGPWTLIDTIAINTLPGGVDTDPKQPLARSFTTDNAVISSGWYRVSFIDAAANILYVNPVQNVPPAQEPWYPSLSDVGLEVLSRTKDTFGTETGTFSANTKPTETQVLRIIQKAALDVADMIGDDIPTVLYDDAGNVVAKRAAMMIERTYYPDQVNTGRSVYPQLKEEYESSMKRLQTQITLIGEGELRVSDSGTSNSPSYSFPDAQSILKRRM